MREPELSRQKQELLRRAEEAFNTTGPWVVEDFVTEDVEWGTTGAFPGIDRVYRGVRGMDRWREDLRSVWASFEVAIVDVLDETDDRLVVEERVRGVGRESGLDVEMSIFSTYYFRDGKLARRVAHKGRDDALAAAGLGEVRGRGAGGE